MLRCICMRKLENFKWHPYIFFKISNNNFHTTISDKKDFYETLNINRNSTRQEIKLAYYKLSKQFHPDVNKAENAEDYFKEIQEAYGVLGDEDLKKEYDDSLRGGYKDIDGARRKSPYNQEWKKRSGPIYTGKTAAYNYDEHFRSHYPKNERSYAGGRSSMDANPFSKYPNQEDLNKYWDTKEFSKDEETKIRNKMLLRSIYVLLIFVFFNLVFSIASQNEREHGLRALKKQIDVKSQR